MAARVETVVTSPSTCQVVLELFILCVKCLYTIALNTYYMFKERPQTLVKNDVVLITGAGHGIGKELAKQYASEGATVVCWDINAQNNEDTVKEIARLGYKKAHAYTCDISNQKEVEEVAKRVTKEVGCVTILINNAGIAYIKQLLKTDFNEVEKTLRTNTMSHFWTIKAFLPGMQSINRGHIVGIASIAGLYGSRNGAPYCASKFAIRGMMEALFQELRLDEDNAINITVIYPAGVDTGIFKKAHTRFPGLLPIISPEQAASYIMKAQRQNLFEFSIPSYSLLLHSVIRLFPYKAQEYMLDFFDTYIIE